MKTTTIKGFVAVVLFFSLCSLSCQKDPDCSTNPPVTDYYLSEKDSMKIPYTGYDTLVYWYEAGGTRDTITYIGKGKEYFYVDEEIRYGYCVDEITRDHGFKILFEAKESKAAIPEIVFSAWAIGNFLFEANKLELRDDLMVVEWISYQGYISYIEFDDVGYGNVALFIRNGNRFFYNRKYGLIRVEFSDENKFQIIP